jgi:hypothetical protein
MQMPSIKTTFAAISLAGGLAAASVGLGTGLAIAQPPPCSVPGGEIPPPNAPPKPTQVWLGEPVVWTSGWGGRWGVCKNGQILLLSKNIVTGGG